MTASEPFGRAHTGSSGRRWNSNEPTMEADMQKTRIESKRRNDRGGASAPTPADDDGRSVVAPSDLRAEMVSVAAYFIAQRRGFTGGCAEDDWYAAEAEIDRRLAKESTGTGDHGGCG